MDIMDDVSSAASTADVIFKFPRESERFPFPCKDSGPTERVSWNGKHSFSSVLA